MSDQVLVKIWHDGKLCFKPRVKYMGGSTSIVQIEVDKMSYFEIVDYVIENGSYNAKDFQMYYLEPGKKIASGLVLLKSDADVQEMVAKLGDDFKHMVHLYVQGAEHIESTTQPGLEKPIIQAQSSPINNPTSVHVQVSTIDADLISQTDGCTDASDGSDASFEEVDVQSEKEELLCAGSDTDDEEWHLCVQNTQTFHNEEEQAKNQLLNNLLQEKEVVPSPSPQSSYEDSDADVLSPGESEDDDVRGKKYKTLTPTVNEFTDWTKWEWVVGTRFESREAFKSALRNYAVCNGRNVTISTSNKKRGGRLGVTCVQGCPFRLYVSFNDKLACYMIKSVRSGHTCQRNMSKNRQLSQSYIADTFLPIFKTKPNWIGKEIQDAVKEKFKVLITPWQAYNAKRVAHKKLHGSMKEHYGKIGSYLAALRSANPSSTFELLTVPSTYFGNEPGAEVFLRLFVCFEGVKRGFLAGCRKLLCLDGCFLKTFLGGMLLAAIGRDANDQMYPVAWAVVEGENNDSWSWFMNELKKCLEVNDEGRNWTLISDQQKGLLNAVALLWPEAEHRNCARHIYANWHKKHKGDELKGCFWSAVRAYCEPDFKNAIGEMRELSTQAVDDLMQQNLKAFCRCYLETKTKTDVIVNNMAETFNGYIVKSRSKHIINMLEDIRVAIMIRLTKNLNKMAAKDVKFYHLDKSKGRAYRCEVLPSSNTVFQVKELDDVVVDMVHGTCSCRKWDSTGIPCHHACAIIGFLNKNAEDYVHKQYTKEMYIKAYEHTIPPLPSEKYWPAIEFPLEPPPVKAMPGRPKKNRKKDPHEHPKKPGKLTKNGCSVTCSNCKGKGHNKRRCPKKSNEHGKGASTSKSQEKHEKHQNQTKRGRKKLKT